MGEEKAPRETSKAPLLALKPDHPECYIVRSQIARRSVNEWEAKKSGSAWMTSVNADFLAKWHPVVNERDLVGLEKLLAGDVTMGAPPYWDKLNGRPLVHHLLGLIIHTIEDFTYHREWHDDSRENGEIALEFRGHIGELDIQGIDLISLNERGEIQNLDVMIRPMNALAALRDVIAPQMAEYLRNIAS